MARWPQHGGILPRPPFQGERDAEAASAAGETLALMQTRLQPATCTRFTLEAEHKPEMRRTTQLLALALLALVCAAQAAPASRLFLTRDEYVKQARSANAGARANAGAAARDRRWAVRRARSQAASLPRRTPLAYLCKAVA